MARPCKGRGERLAARFSYADGPRAAPFQGVPPNLATPFQGLRAFFGRSGSTERNRARLSTRRIIRAEIFQKLAKWKKWELWLEISIFDAPGT